jgi:PPOX class probable F420-dependent enzyme
MIGNEDQDAFITTHKLAVVTTLRRDGSPSNSVIFYAREGDELLFSTTKSRLKAKTLMRDPRIAVCVLEEGPPYNFVNVEGTATVQTEDIVPGHILVLKAMRGPDATPPDGYEERLAKEGRVIVRVKAERVSGVTARR